MTTLPIHQLPAARMRKLTDKACHDALKAKLQSWVERNIVADDPRSQEEQMRDEMAPDRSQVWFPMFVVVCVAVLIAGWLIIF